nr:putative ribonuclease H-like domain-containing protein [Tanacetum cinerariifolium]
MSYLSKYEEIDGGYVGFERDPKGGKITVKGKIRTGKLDFKDVYFVKELKFNLFSISQMCDKKNIVLFTDTECVVLSPNFKLLDESQVLLRVLRKNNMYSVDLKNVSPSGATKDETSGILKAFITGIKNLIDHKVKTIRCDNGTEFKNKEMNQFCEMKGIRSEFSVARTPQQNGQGEKKPVSGPQYILLPLLTSDSQGTKSSEDEVDDDAGKKRRERAQRNEFESMFGQDKNDNGIRIFTHVNAVGPTYVYLGGSIPVNAATLPNADLCTNPLMLDLEDTADTGIFSDAYDVKLRVSMPLELNGSIKNKKDERGIVVRNKARLVVQGYTQEEGIDYDEVFAPITRIEAIRLFLAYASFMGFIVYQMNIKSSFLYGTIEEEVYVCQSPGFEDLHFSNKVYKVEKALYGLHQAPKAWYETLSTYLLENRFQRGIIDKTLFIKKGKGDILLVQKDDGVFISQDKYVADILKKFEFFSVKTASTPIETNKALLKDEEDVDVDVHLYKSMIGSLMYLTASRPDIMFAICTCARFQVTSKVSHLQAMKRIFRYLKGQPKLGLWYSMDSPFDLEAFSDSDYVGASLDRKSTTGGCQFLGKKLISWQCKTQTVVDNSTTEAECVAAASYCGQVLWIQN